MHAEGLRAFSRLSFGAHRFVEVFSANNYVEILWRVKFSLTTARRLSPGFAVSRCRPSRTKYDTGGTVGISVAVRMGSPCRVNPFRSVIESYMDHGAKMVPYTEICRSGLLMSCLSKRQTVYPSSRFFTDNLFARCVRFIEYHTSRGTLQGRWRLLSWELRLAADKPFP